PAPRPTTPRGRRARPRALTAALAAVLAALLYAGAALGAAPPAHAADPTGGPADGAVAAADDAGWFTSWAQSQQRVSTKNFANQSMRMVTRLSQGGDTVRIRLQNQFGVGPVVIDQTSLALSAGGPAIVPGTDRVLTFDGARSVTIP